MTHPETARAQKQPTQDSAQQQPAISDHTIPAHAHASGAALHAEDQGYHKGLKPRQVQMIAIGGAIGTGLFMGAGGRLATAGPALIISYAVCGFFAFMILRALGELVMHRPSSGSFVSYAREFFGEKAAFVTGWLYWLNWAMTAIVDITAVALYMNFFKKYWAPIADVPQWVWALAALILVLGLNLISVKVFGELEFWFALIKVVALVSFLMVGIYFVIFGTPVAGHEVGFSLIADNGGMFPNGLLPAIVVMQGVVFAYASIELIGTAAGETENPEKIMPRAINTVIVRIAVFYVGSLVLLSLLLPYSSYKAGESPFVTFFGSIGVDGVDAIMNLVVLDRGAVLAQRGPVLHRPDHAFHVRFGFRAEIRRPDEQVRRPLRRHRPHRRCGGPRRGPERRGPGRGLRDRPERRIAGHHQHLGHDRPVPDAAGAARSPR